MLPWYLPAACTMVNPGGRFRQLPQRWLDVALAKGWAQRQQCAGPSGVTPAMHVSQKSGPFAESSRRWPQSRQAGGRKRSTLALKLLQNFCHMNPPPWPNTLQSMFEQMLTQKRK
jgi:hypothetical protein